MANSMVQVDVREANQKLQALAKLVSRENAAKATRMALNEAIRKGKTETRRAVQAIYNIKASRLNDPNKKKGLSVKLATNKKLSAEIDAGHIPLSLSDANPKFQGEAVASKVSFGKNGKAKKGQAIRRSTGVITVEILKGQRKKLATAFTIGTATHASSGQQFATTAIFARGKKNKVGFAFSKPRLPIDSLSTVSVATAALSTKSQEKIQPIVNQYVNQRMEHHLKRMLNESI